MILARLKALLNQLGRRFELIAETRSAPKGTVLWSEYVTRELPRGDFLSVPCRFPDLRDDRQLKGAIRFALEKQLRSLDTLREQGTFIHRLIEFAESLLRKVETTPSRRPCSREMGDWMRRPLRTDAYVDGLQAIDWTVEDRGLAGLSDLEGVPWTMPMEKFFEAWVETVFRKVVLRSGGILKTGRRWETVAPISWDPPFLASQRSLVPDLILETEDTTFIIDAKYKRHFEELQQRPWHEQEVRLREQHRADLLQVLAYANLAAKARVICCLVYPCTMETWESLRGRGRLFHRAELPYRGRQIHIRLTALPMHAQLERIASPLIDEFKSPASGLGRPGGLPYRL